MSIVKGVFVTPQNPDGVKPTMQGMRTVGRPADPHFAQYTQTVPVKLLHPYRRSWRGSSVYVGTRAPAYLIAWPDGTYHLIENPQSMFHFDDTPTEGVDFTF